MTHYPTPKAVVLTSAGVFYDNGNTHPLSARLKLDDLYAVLRGASQAFRRGEGVVLLDTPIPTDPDVMKRVGAEWKYSELRAWTTFVGEGIVHLGFLPALADNPGPLLRGAQGPADMASRLGRYHQLVGVAWRYTAGVTACASIRDRFDDSRPGRQPRWRSPGPKGIRGAGPLIWKASEQPDVDDPRPVAMFDINAMYLAALRNVQLAWGPLAHSKAIGFDPGRPGWWELDAARVPTELVDGADRPPVLRRARVHKGALWVSTPVAKYLSDLIGSVDVLDSYTAENSQGIMRPFAERLAAARTGQLGPIGACEPALKRTYAELVGMVLREGGSIYRPDWSYSVMDLARVNLLRRLDKAYEATKLRPFEVRTDAAYFLVDDQDTLVRLAESLGTGASPGTFKNARMLTVAEVHAERVARR